MPPLATGPAISSVAMQTRSFRAGDSGASKRARSGKGATSKRSGCIW